MTRALLSASTSSSCTAAATLSRKQHRAPASDAVRCRAAAPVISPQPTADVPHVLSKYAVLAVGNVQQLVEEGNWYCCDHVLLPQKQDQGRITFSNVVALKNNGQFQRGQPFLAGVTVEATVLEEFVSSGGCPTPGSITSSKPQVVTKFLVTKIAGTSS